MQSRSSELRVDRGQRQPAPLRECFQLPPPFGHIVVEREDPAGEAQTNVAVQPALPRRASRV
jgi:hypothetical protein